MIKQKLVFLWILCGSLVVFGTDESDKTENIQQARIGNTALPVLLQPGPLIGFGQNIVDQGDCMAFVYVDYLKSNRKSLTEVSPSILYGLKDNVSLFIQLPIAAQFKLNNTVSHGLQDLLIQVEYAFYNQTTESASNQITLVTNINLPTGSSYFSFGSPAYFVGLTGSHIDFDWYYFASTGALITTSNNDTRFGNQFYYQCGVSKNIKYVADRWIFNWMVEFDGFYTQSNTIAGNINSNSGSNEILLGPSLWFSTQRLILQGGISWYVYQTLFGNQKNKDNYYVAFNIGWKF